MLINKGKFRQLKLCQHGSSHIHVLESQNFFDHCNCLGNRLRPEKDPCHVDKQESNHPLQNRMHGIPLFLKHSGQRVGYAVEKSPENKRPVGSMPQAADKKYDNNINICTDCSLTASSQWKINVGSQKPGQRQMPAAPEIHHGKRFVGRVKVHGDLNIKHIPQSGCHIAVTAEIKVDLEGIGKHHQDPFHRCDPGRYVSVPPGNSLAERIRYDNFFYKSRGKHIDAMGHIS